MLLAPSSGPNFWMPEGGTPPVLRKLTKPALCVQWQS